MKLIIDEFTDLPISRQRKWQLRHPEKSKAINHRYWHSDKCRKRVREYMRKRTGVKNPYIKES